MKKFLPLLFLIIAILPATAQEDTIRHLIFTEWRGDEMQSAYVELTNVGSVSVGLSKFTLATIRPNVRYPTADVRHQKRLEGTLAPGESYLIMTVYEGITGTGRSITRTKMLPLADLKVYVVEGGVENDSISKYDRLLRLFNGIYSSVLWYRLENGDSVIVDAVNNAINLATGTHFGVPGAVAGFESATLNSILVRKANIGIGNPNWDNARGISLEDSEWLPVPHDGNNPDGSVFSTVKEHGNYSISLTSTTIGINMTDTILTLPWGIMKGDSIMEELNIGPNMIWNYQENSNAADSAYNICMPGDILTLYALGNQLQKMDFKLSVSEPSQTENRLFPLRNYSFTTGAWSTASRYYVTKNQPVIDTIGNVPFGTPVDTLLTYLQKAPLSSWEIVWVDGVTRVDLKNGDKVKVTAANGTSVKEYFIDVQEFVASGNANLSSITWPDLPFFIDGWKGDTIPFFETDRFSYFIKLPYGTKNIPALVAMTESLNAKVQVKRAVSFKGSVEDRTTTFTVTAQDDTTIQTYSILFDVEKIGEQIFKAEPYFSQVVHKHFSQNSFLEITNPGNVPLSLDEYMIIQRNVAGSPASAIQADLVNDATNWGRRYYKYVPGFKFQTLENWTIKAGLLDFDPTVDPTLNPGDVFVIGRLHTNPARRPAEQVFVDMHFSNNLPNVWGEMGWNNNAMCWTQTYSIFYLFKIENDSILEGKKPVGDPQDFRLIDMFGSAAAENWTVAGLTATTDGWSYIRKPDIWKGNPESKGSFGTNLDDSEWIPLVWAGTGTDWAPVSVGIGTHVVNPVTVYISTVSSPTYLVSDGFEDLQSIQSNFTGKTLENFYEFIIKGDPDQLLTMKSGVNGTPKALGDQVANNDTLIVVSADKTNTTRYVLINQPLDSDAILTASVGSDYTIEINGTLGTISGMSYGIRLAEVLENVIVPENAILNVVNENDELVPLRKLNYDTIYVDVKVGDSFMLEVTAQDGVTVIKYKLVPAVLAGDAFVISNTYNVDQENFIISEVPIGTSVSSFFALIEIAGKANAVLTNKMGVERELGLLAFDDRLVVTSENLSKTVTYSLDFLTELNPDRSSDATLSDLTVNGLTVPGFDPDTHSYTVLLNNGAGVPAIPVVGAMVNNLTAMMTIVQAVNLEGNDAERTAKVNVVAQDGATEIMYSIIFNLGVGISDSKNEQLRVYAEGNTIYIKTKTIGQNDEVEVYNIMGQKILHRKMASTFERLQIDNQGGMIIVRIKWNGTTRIEKLILH